MWFVVAVCVLSFTLDIFLSYKIINSTNNIVDTIISKSPSSILTRHGFRDARISFPGSAATCDYVLVDMPYSLLVLSLSLSLALSLCPRCDRGDDSATFIASFSYTFITYSAVCLACDRKAFLSDIFNSPEKHV